MLITDSGKKNCKQMQYVQLNNCKCEWTEIIYYIPIDVNKNSTDNIERTKKYMCISFIISQNLVVCKFRDNFRQKVVEFSVGLARGGRPLGLKLSRAPLRQVPSYTKYKNILLNLNQLFCDLAYCNTLYIHIESPGSSYMYAALWS